MGINLDERDVIEFYRQRAKENLEKYEALGAATKQTGKETYDHFDITSPTNKRQIRQWTRKFREGRTLDPAAVKFDEETADDWLEDYRIDRPYDYDKEKKIYTFYDCPPSFETLEFELDKIKEIIECYSNIIIRGQTRNETEQSVEVPKPTIVHILDALGITHDSEPYTREEMLEGNPKLMAAETLAKKRSKYFTELAKTEEKAQEEDAEKYRKIQAGQIEPALEVFEDFEFNWDPPEYDYHFGKDDGFAVVIFVSDLHLGRRIYRAKNRPRSLEDMRQIFLKSFFELVDRIEDSWFPQPEKYILGLGGDFFQVDTYDETTTYGTDVLTNASTKEIIDVGLDTLWHVLENLRKRAPVHFMPVEGNHDRVISYLVQDEFGKLYIGNDSITIDQSAHSRKYARYGKNLIGVCHGFDEPTSKLPRLMPNEAASMWEEDQKRVFFFGHDHNKMIDDSDPTGVTLVRAPALADDDQHEAKKGFMGSLKGIQSHVFHAEEGPLDIIPTNVVI